MFDDIFPNHVRIYYEKGGEGGAGGGSGGSPDSGGEDGEGEGSVSQEQAVSENQQNISELSKQISGGGEDGDQPDMMARHIGYGFEDEEGAEASQGEEGPEGSKTEPEPQGGEPEGGEGEEAQTTGEGEKGGESPDIDPEKEDHFYVHDRDAEDRDVYPNDYESRMDAQFAMSEKIQTFDDYVETLEENDSGIGAAVDPEIQQKIEKYRNLDYPNQVEDDKFREDIADMDEALKAVKMKSERVQEQAQKSQAKKETEKKYKKAEKVAQKSSEEIGLPDRLNELPENFEKGDLMELVDEQIQAQVSDLDQQIEDFKNNEEYLEDHSLQEYTNRLEELQQQRREKVQQMQEHKENIDNWWEAQQEFRNAKQETSDPTDAELMKMRDQAFVEFQEDRSQGPNALDIFTKSKDTKPITHFRQYALSPANIDKYDLTTPQGWVKMHRDWKSWINDNVKEGKTTSKKKKSDEQKSRKPIPSPSDNNNSRRMIPAGSNVNDISESNDRISKLSKEIMGG